MTQPRKAHAENAPKMETPEEPTSVPEDVPRAEDPEVETPEEKPPSLVEQVADHRGETRAISREEFIGQLVETAKGQDVEHIKFVVPEVGVSAVLASSDDVFSQQRLEELELQRHVAQNPVDSHAPAWYPREPNSP